jgi:uncharacterized protein YcbK (DUF882 family)
MGLIRRISTTAADLPRRRLLASAGAAAACFILRPAMAAVEPARARRLCLTNLHTGETCAADYWAEGGYLSAGLDDIAKVLRDHRNGATHPIDPKLLDLLHTLQSTLETTSPFQVISGYRSPASNAKLAAASSGVAKHSMHMDGKAIDIRLPGVALGNVHKAAKALKGGGVGYYAASNFVHMDVGRVRYW